jgi:hypothetical protein
MRLIIFCTHSQTHSLQRNRHLGDLELPETPSVGFLAWIFQTTANNSVRCFVVGRNLQNSSDVSAWVSHRLISLPSVLCVTGAHHRLIGLELNDGDKTHIISGKKTFLDRNAHKLPSECEQTMQNILLAPHPVFVYHEPFVPVLSLFSAYSLVRIRFRHPYAPMLQGNGQGWIFNKPLFRTNYRFQGG